MPKKEHPYLQIIDYVVAVNIAYIIWVMIMSVYYA